MPVDPIRLPNLEMDRSAVTERGGRAHMPEDRPRQELFSIYVGSLLTAQISLLCFYKKRGQALLRFGNEKILLSSSRLTKPTDTAFNWKPPRQPNALNKKVQQKGGQVVAQTLFIQCWLRCPGSSSHMGIHANVQLGGKQSKTKPSDLLKHESKQEHCSLIYKFYINNNNNKNIRQWLQWNDHFFS